MFQHGTGNDIPLKRDKMMGVDARFGCTGFSRWRSIFLPPQKKKKKERGDDDNDQFHRLIDEQNSTTSPLYTYQSKSIPTKENRRKDGR